LLPRRASGMARSRIGSTAALRVWSQLINGKNGQVVEVTVEIAFQNNPLLSHALNLKLPHNFKLLEVFT
jgi:hypothetical protein